MTAALVRLALTACLLAPASADAGSARPLVSLTASPTHVTLLGAASATIRVTNSGHGPVVFDAGRAAFALDLRGRPRIVPRARTARVATSWLTVRPRRLALRAGQSGWLTVSSAVPRVAQPGDHEALVLLTTRAPQSARVAVRMRLGIVVVVRVPGAIVRRLELRRLRVRRVGRVRVLDLFVANRGNVTEDLVRGRVRLSLLRHGRVLARLRPKERELLPRTSGIEQFRYDGPVRGRVTALAEITSTSGGVEARRAFPIRL